jgi:hypothetical protein
MTVTKSERQPSGNVDAGETEEDVYDARARDGQRTSFGDSLPDTERVREEFADWIRNAWDVIVRVGDGSFWDEQPPSPRELVERYRESPWAHSEYGLLVLLRKAGLVTSIAWSLPFYALAILGQRFGRALTAITIVIVFWNLI